MHFLLTRGHPAQSRCGLFRLNEDGRTTSQPRVSACKVTERQRGGPSQKRHTQLIAYRAETALAQLAREKLRRLDDARSLIRQLFRTEIRRKQTVLGRMPLR